MLYLHSSVLCLYGSNEDYVVLVDVANTHGGNKNTHFHVESILCSRRKLKKHTLYPLAHTAALNERYKTKKSSTRPQQITKDSYCC